MCEIINVLWTGGWDSTFRIIELSRKNVCVQPIYVKDPNRKSLSYEKQAMSKILKLLNEKAETKAEFYPIKEIELENIPKNDDITKAYEIIQKRTGLGAQHEWLARLAVKYPGIEIGTEAGSVSASRILKSIEIFGFLEERNGTHILNKDKSSKEGVLVLGNLSFPIIDKTETDMKRLIELWGYEDVISNIWFCHNPKKGKPCGICHPCQVKLVSGMEFLLPKKSLSRGKRYKALERYLGTRITTKIFHH